MSEKKRKPLPSINALRSFETTARLGSVTKAAEELFVTPSAVSHQIRKLEERFDRKLVDFAGGQVTLTEWGSVLFPGLTDGFMRIREAIYLLEDRSTIETLTIAARPLFASKWLSPRLDRFWEMHPDIALRMRYLTQRFDPSRDTADASIEWYAESPRDANYIQLFAADLAPVCSPSLKIDTTIESLPESLNRVVVLRETSQDYWQNWLKQMNAPDFQPEHTAFLDDGSIRLKTAMAGKGIDLSVPSFLEQELASKLLIEPFPDARLEGGYYLMLPGNPSATAITFRDWLLDEIEDDPMLRSKNDE